MVLSAPAVDTVPRPGIWVDTPAKLTGGFLVQMARRLDRVFPIAFFERLVRFVWNRVQRSARSELPLTVKNCGWMISVAGIDFHRVGPGQYMNFEDPIRAGTGAAMYYRLQVDKDRGTLTGSGSLTAPAWMVSAAATVRLELREGHDDHWLRVCGAVPDCENLDGDACG